MHPTRWTAVFINGRSIRGGSGVATARGDGEDDDHDDDGQKNDMDEDDANDGIMDTLDTDADGHGIEDALALKLILPRLPGLGFLDLR